MSSICWQLEIDGMEVGIFVSIYSNQAGASAYIDLLFHLQLHLHFQENPITVQIYL